MYAYAYYAYDLPDTVDWGMKMLGLIFSNKLDCGSYIISIAKTASKIIGALIRSMKILTLDVALHFYKSTIRPWMEDCCHVWTGAPSCYLELLGKLRKWICRTAGSWLASIFFTQPLSHCQNVASVSFFYRCYLGRCSFEFLQLVPLPQSPRRSTLLHDFSVKIPMSIVLSYHS